MSSANSQEEVLGEFLEELAGHLIKCGITMEDFRVAAINAFVNAAVSMARLQNSRVNQSAIAVVTGLSRAKVRRLLRNATESSVAISTRLSAVISGWRTDPEFTDLDGSPIALPLSAKQRSFASLVRKYGRDVSYRAVLTEMNRIGVVRMAGNKLVLQSGISSARNTDMTRLLTQGFAHVLRGSVNGSTSVVDVITGEATYELPDGVSKVILRRRLAQGTKAFAADIQASAEATASRYGRRKKAKKVSTRVLVVTVG